jgi:hypothetical protein
MSNKKSITDFKDLRKAIEEIQKNQPAKTRYQQQAEKMNYMQEAADEKDDKKDSGLLKRKDHAGEEEIKKAYLALGTEAQGSVEYQRGLIQKELAKMGYKTYSKFAFDSIFKFENNTMGLKEAKNLMPDLQKIVDTKGASKVSGITIDMFTASVITKAYAKVNDANKKKMETASIQTLVNLAQKMMGMKEWIAKDGTKIRVAEKDKRKLKEHSIDESKMGDLLIDIQQGATAKEIAKNFNISLSVAKEFLKDYYGQKKGSRKEEVKEGTWAIPKTSKEKKRVKDLMKNYLGLGIGGDSAIEKIGPLIGDDEMLDDLAKAGKKNPNTDARPIIKKAMKRLGIKEEVSREDQLKEERTHAKQSPFKLKSQQYPRAIAIDIKGHGKRHATELDITEACNSFGMITDQELQIEQIQKQLGKQGFISYTKSDLQDVFEDRETERMIYALESITEEQLPIEYTKDQIEDSYIMSEEVEFVKPDGQKTAGPVLKLCENTFNVKDKYTGKSFTYKYINEENNVRTFRDITEAKFSAQLIKQAGGIAFDKRYYMGNMTGAISAIEKLKKGLSDDPKVKALLRTANENANNNFFKALTTEDQEAYQKFFKSVLKKFDVSSPAELDDDKKKEFFDYIDKNWKGDGEKKESIEVGEGKFTKYSDLLVKKAKLVAQGPTASKEVAAINKQIAAEMKKLGVKEENINEVSIGDAGIQKDFPNVWAQKDKRMNKILIALVNLHGFMDNLKSYKKDKKKFVDTLKAIGKNDASLKKAGLTKREIGEKSRVDGRTTNFREKMRKLGYIKGPSFGN